MSSLTEKELCALLQRAASGEPNASSELFAQYRDQLMRAVRSRMDRQLRSRLDPSDVVQDAMASAAKRLPNFYNNGGRHFYMWLRKIAFERLIQLHRFHVGATKRSVLRETIGLPKLSDDSVVSLSKIVSAPTRTPVSEVIQGELLQRLRSGLDELPEADQEVLVLRHLEHLSVKEVASELGLSEAATQSRYRRAIERLHKRLRNVEPDSRV